MIDDRKLMREIKSLRNGKIVQGHTWVSQDNITLEEGLAHIQNQMEMGFLKFRIEEGDPVSDEGCMEILKHMVRERTEDLDMSDLCGAPWARVELRHLRTVYKRLEEWSDGK
jgi:hypothetical protein